MSGKQEMFFWNLVFCVQGRKQPVTFKVRDTDFGVESWMRQSLWYFLGCKYQWVHSRGSCLQELCHRIWPYHIWGPNLGITTVKTNLWISCLLWCLINLVGEVRRGHVVWFFHLTALVTLGTKSLNPTIPWAQYQWGHLYFFRTSLTWSERELFA